MRTRYTKKQGEEIISLWTDDNSMKPVAVNDIIRTAVDFLGAKAGFTFNSNQGEEMVNAALALANPVTREITYSRFVEKETRYFWTTKKETDSGQHLMLFHGAGGVVQMRGPEEALTESEIVEWGFNPDAFNKREAD